MMFVPSLQIGIWNAWLFMLYVLFYNIFPLCLSSLGPQQYQDIFKKAVGLTPPLTKTETTLSLLLFFFFITPIVYSFFLPVKQATIWFYIGLCIYLLGIFLGTRAMYDFYTTSVDNLVTKGVYQLSRNPMYLGMFLLYLGTGIAAASWLFLAITLIFIALSHVQVHYEEHFCLQKYKHSYRNYLKNTPRWIGIPKNK